ncbi:MAG: undecaprenyl-diphosphate phosphatase [Synergistaceae bacterium]|jgi:undecaprenyl-diphosphatase|nr:undecaprenyl-diphosphate phosphatase [Synergistaceae bacterium]
MDPQALVLGLIQGLTEFLPVSSSGHLGLARAVMGIGEPAMAYDLVLHMATLLAVIVYFSSDLLTLLVEWLYGFFNKNARNWVGWRFGWAVIAGSAITGPLGVLLKRWSEAASMNTFWIGGGFWLTALLLGSAKYIPNGERPVSVWNGAAAGLMQGLAVMPGLSRSGATIWAGILTGMSREEAFRFSFLLSIPAIIGATLYEGRDMGGLGAFFAALPPDWLQGAAIALCGGILSLFLLRRLVMGDKWWMFSIYCMLLGTISLVFSIMGA